MGYDGGKGQAGIWQRIVSQMPPHRVYVEPFLGSGVVYLAKRPAEESILIDLDPDPIARISVVVRHRGLPAPHAICGDAISWLETHSLTPDTLVYCDPPYLFSTRAGGSDRIYRHELGEESEHRRLLSYLVSSPAMVMISGYPSSLYSAILEGWRELRYRVVRRSGKLAEEVLWCNFPQPVELHDYRWLGEGFRQREVLKRRKQRWVRRLLAMPLLERQMLAAAIAECVEAVPAAAGTDAPSPASSMSAASTPSADI